MNNRLGVSDISSSEMLRIRTEFENDVRIRQLRCKQKLTNQKYDSINYRRNGQVQENI